MLEIHRKTATFDFAPKTFDLLRIAESVRFTNENVSFDLVAPFGSYNIKRK